MRTRIALFAKFNLRNYLCAQDASKHPIVHKIAKGKIGLRYGFENKSSL